MEKHNLKTLTIAALSAVFLLFFLSLTVQPSASQTTFNWKWSPQVAFRLPAYNTVIAFSDYVYMNSFTWDAFNASAITFNNICLQGEPETAPQFTISLKNANMTIQHLLHNKQFIAELNGATGTVAELSITNSLYQSMPGTVAVAGLPLTTPCTTKAEFDKYGGNTWYYDTTTNTVYVKAVLHSPTSIYIDWNPPPAPAPAPTPTPTPTPTPQPTITPPAIPIWLILPIVACIVVIGYIFIKKR
jgi:hypothetical protein